jgi:hypothetical protein
MVDRSSFHPCARPGKSVERDWFGDLQAGQLHVFRAHAREFEHSYLMFSISLNEAISLHAGGLLSKSFLAVFVTPGLCGHLTGHLENVLRSLAEHAKSYGTSPSVAPLNPADFYGDWGQRSALKSLVWHHALRTRESQFQSKIRTLRSMVGHIGNDFAAAAEALASLGIAIDSPDLWAAMDAGHFDLNTCLRESMILLKCFLRVLPDEEIVDFEKTVSRRTTPSRSALASPNAKGGEASARAAPDQEICSQ